MKTGISMTIEGPRRRRKKTPIADMRRMVVKRTTYSPELAARLTREQCENLLTQAFAFKRSTGSWPNQPDQEAVPTGCVPGKVA